MFTTFRLSVSLIAYAPPPCLVGAYCYYRISQDQRTSLLYAAYGGHVEVVAALIQAKADIEAREKVSGESQVQGQQGRAGQHWFCSL